MTPNPVSHRLASGHPATILVMRPKAVILDPGYRKAPEPSQIALARRLGEARLERPLTPLPLPDVMLASPERVDHPRFGPIEIFSARAKAALAGGPGQAGLYCLRQMSAELDDNALIANATYFLFKMPDLDAPWNAYGDPYGLVLSGGIIDYPPQLPRACLLTGGAKGRIGRLGFSDVGITAGGHVIRAHPFGLPTDGAGPFTAFARFHGETGGHAPPGEGYDVAYIGRHAVAGAPAGRLPIPRAGCVVRYPASVDAGRAIQPLTYSLPVEHSEGVQAGPTILRDGNVTDSENVFASEHMHETEALGMPGSVSPANWKADWDVTRAARLGAGVDAQGHVVLVAIEGASSTPGLRDAAYGATLRDLALLLKECGATDALHLDGGGSTQVFGAAGGALIAPSDVYHDAPERAARYDRPVPNWLHLTF